MCRGWERKHLILLCYRNFEGRASGGPCVCRGKGTTKGGNGEKGEGRREQGRHGGKGERWREKERHIGKGEG